MTLDDSATATVSMQKRRIASNKGQVLPLIDGDTKGNSSAGRIRQKDSGGVTCLAVVIIIVTLIVLALFVGKTSTETFQNDGDLARPLALSEFETVNRALKHSNLVAIYFAASWCPMSTPITNLLEDSFSSVPNLLYTSGNSLLRKELAIVHVSSDTSQSAMEAYLKPGWIAVPFDSNERIALKKHFFVCAQRELQQLGIERKLEIPALIIVDGETHSVITTNGVQDLENEGAKALDHWIDLQSILRGPQSNIPKQYSL
jgi:hypothetical protein